MGRAPDYLHGRLWAAGDMSSLAANGLVRTAAVWTRLSVKPPLQAPLFLLSPADISKARPGDVVRGASWHWPRRLVARQLQWASSHGL